MSSVNSIITREAIRSIPAMEISDEAALPQAPLVSVLMVTYNHERYLAEAIEGVIMQQCDFSIELLIGEDYSTDLTREICLEYQRKYPQLIRVVTAVRNVGMNPNFLRLMARARGKYLAYCEGDDYWTDREKLARQVRYMEAHPECPLCFTAFEIIRQQSDGGHHRVRISSLEGRKDQFTIRELFKRSIYIHVCTIMERAGVVKYPVWYPNVLSADWVHIVLHADTGPIARIPAVTAAYRMHEGGIWNGSSEEYRITKAVESTRWLDEFCGRRYHDYFSGKLSGLHLSLARIKARRGERRAARALLWEAWNEAENKTVLLQKELCKLGLALLSNPLYTWADKLIKRLTGSMRPGVQQPNGRVHHG